MEAEKKAAKKAVEKAAVPAKVKTPKPLKERKTLKKGKLFIILVIIVSKCKSLLIESSNIQKKPSSSAQNYTPVVSNLNAQNGGTRYYKSPK